MTKAGVLLVALLLPFRVQSFCFVPSKTTPTSTSLSVSLPDDVVAAAALQQPSLETLRGAAAVLQTEAESLIEGISTGNVAPADLLASPPLQAAAAATAGIPAIRYGTQLVRSVQQLTRNKVAEGSDAEPTYPEAKAATYDMNDNVVPFEFGDAMFVRPLLKQTQLETRPLRVAYDANRDGYDAKTFHAKVDGQGAAVVLAKSGGRWIGGYNPRGWASLGSARSSVASFLFYKKRPGGWQKLRVSRTGSMACGNDLFDAGIYFGADSLVMPLRRPNERSVTSRLGQYFEERPDGKLTVLPRAGEDFRLESLKVLVGVYEDGEDIPNSGGVLELGFY